jgi:hypothetical protein
MLPLPPRDCFPHMPDELFDMWIKPEIASRGWPFRGDETIVSDPAWAKYLRNHGPHFWRAVRWNRVSQSFVGIPIEKRAKDLTNKLACFAREFAETGFTPPGLIKGSLPKILALADVTNANGEIPKPLVCLVQGDEWWLMDGHHRLAALFLLGTEETTPFDCWLGTHVL